MQVCQEQAEGLVHCCQPPRLWVHPVLAANRPRRDALDAADQIKQLRGANNGF